MENAIVERWGVMEITLPGKTEGNPFTDYSIQGRFNGEKESKTVSGFYDGNGLYKVRFMPSCTGVYHYKISGSFSEKETSGAFTVTEASETITARYGYPAVFISHTTTVPLFIRLAQPAMSGRFSPMNGSPKRSVRWKSHGLTKSVSVSFPSTMTTT